MQIRTSFAKKTIAFVKKFKAYFLLGFLLCSQFSGVVGEATVLSELAVLILQIVAAKLGAVLVVGPETDPLLPGLLLVLLRLGIGCAEEILAVLVRLGLARLHTRVLIYHLLF